MNYLSHFYIDRHSTDPYFVLGTSMPDLWEGFSAIFNTTLRHQMGRHVQHPEVTSLSMGVLRHYEVDKVFHGLEQFDACVDSIKKELKGAKMKTFNRRIYVFAHILFEMMLDRHIILNEAAVIDDFYELLGGTQKEKLSEFIELHGLEDRTGNVRRNLDRFLESKFLYHYSDLGGIAYGLNRIHMRINKKEISSADRETLSEALQKIDDSMKHNWQNTFKLVQDQISQHD